MQTITTLTLICTILVLALLGLAVYTRLAAESARANGYNEGYDDAKLAAHGRATALNNDIARLQELATANRAEHSQAIEAMILDCDTRISIYAARALTAEDAILLRCANKQLLAAAKTFSEFPLANLADQARFALSVAGQLEHLARRVEANFTAQAVVAEAAA